MCDPKAIFKHITSVKGTRTPPGPSEGNIISAQSCGLGNPVDPSLTGRGASERALCHLGEEVSKGGSQCIVSVGETSSRGPKARETTQACQDPCVPQACRWRAGSGPRGIPHWIQPACSHNTDHGCPSVRQITTVSVQWTLGLQGWPLEFSGSQSK